MSSRPGGVQQRYLNQFNSGFTPNIRNILVDKLQLRFRGYRIQYSSPDMLRAYARQVAGAWDVFNVRIGTNKIVLQVKKGWLFGGRITLFITPGADSVRECVAQVDLELNPTRFFAHRWSTMDEINRASVFDLLRVNPELELAARRSTLDGNDNILHPQQLFKRRPFPAWTMVYLEKVIDLLNTMFVGAADPSEHVAYGADWDVRVQTGWNDWTLNRAEFYWECYAPNAVAVVHSLSPKLAAALSASRQSDYGPATTEPFQSSVLLQNMNVENAVSVGGNLGADRVDLLIYAKQFDRLRLEVRYGRNARAIFPQHTSRSQIPSTPEGLGSMLQFLASDARDRLYRVLRAIDRDVLDLPPSVETFSQLISAIDFACNGEAEVIRRVFTLLGENRAISITADNDLMEVVADLERRGAVVRSRPHRRSKIPRYQLATKYQTVMSAVFGALGPMGNI